MFAAAMAQGQAMTQKVAMYTASHSLAEVGSAIQPGSAISRSGIMVTCIAGKDRIVLEMRKGFFMNIRMDTPSGQVRMQMECSQKDPQTHISGHYSLDQGGISQDEWQFCKSRVSTILNDRPNAKTKELKKLKKLKQSMDLCYKAAGTLGSLRQQQIEQAIGLCPEYCSMAFMMKFEMMLNEDSLEEIMERKGPALNEAIRVLEQAVEAGRAFAKLLKLDEFCKGDLYTFFPTRWYVRSLYTLGSFLCSLDGFSAESDKYLKECLAQDIFDKLGARHKQLHLALHRGGMSDEELPFLLKAKFTEDQLEDDVFALWNYTRALHHFATKGASNKVNKKLKLAIDANPHVPPLLLGWESPKVQQFLMDVGGEGEAADYADEVIMSVWSGVEGALDWLQKVYCDYKKVSPLAPNSPEAMALLVEGTRAMLPAINNAKDALTCFKKILALPKTKDNKALRCKVFRRMAFCYSSLKQYPQALNHCNSALRHCDPSERDQFKELLYNRASFKEDSGDFRGAYQDFVFVYERIGPFSTAVEGITRLEDKLNVDKQASALPKMPDVGVTESKEDMDKLFRDISNVMPVINPRNKTVAATMERCSHCQRGGIKLAVCAGCKTATTNGDDGFGVVAAFCSKECQRANWAAVHKYVCCGSKKRLAKGAQVKLTGLKAAQQHNGKVGTIHSFLASKGRFCVQLEDQQLSVRPENIEKM